MGLFDRFRTNIKRLEQERDYPGLIQALDDGDPETRTEAAQALCKLGVSVIPDLLRALENAPPASKIRMERALAHAGIASLPLFLALIVRANPDLQASIARTIAEMGDDAFRALGTTLHHKQPAVRYATVIALQGMGRKAIPHLSEAFHDRDPLVRKEAARVLAVLQWAPANLPEQAEFYFLLEDWAELEKLRGAAVPLLIRALEDKDPRIRSESARTLGKIRDARAIPPLIRATGDPQMDVRVRAVEALGELGDDRAKAPLIEALHDPYHRVRMEAAWALDRLGWIPQNDLQRAEYLIAREQWNDLVQMGRAAIPPLIRALEIGYSGVRTGASEALRQLGRPALEALMAETRANDPARRRRAQNALGYIRRRQAEASRSRPKQKEESSDEYLRELNEGLAIQKRFERTFGRPEYARSRRQVQTPTQPSPPSPPPEEKKPAPEVLDEAAAEPAGGEGAGTVNLNDLLEENYRAEEAWAEVKARLRQEASAGGGPIPLEELIPIEFEEAITGTDRPDAPGELLDEPVSSGPPDGVLQDLEIPVLSREAPIPPEEPVPEKTALERALEALRSSDVSIRVAAIATLQGMGTEAVGYLIEALNDPHEEVRIAAIDGLGNIGGRAAVEALVLLLDDSGVDVRIAAAGALGHIGDRHSIQPLIDLFRDGYHGVRTAAADAVAVFGRDALGPLEAALDDPVPTVRMTAAKAIGLIGATESVPILIEHLGDPAPEVRWSVARALSDYGSLVVEPLFLILRKGKKEMRLAAIEALWEVPDERAGEALVYALGDEDEDVREKAAAALRKRQVIDVWREALGNQVQEERAPKKKRTARQEDMKAFEASGQQEIETLIVALKDKNWNTQLGVATRLIMMGRPAVDGLIQALRDEDHEIQMAAASILGEMRETAVAPLMDALSDSDRFVRLVAARNLGKIGNKRAIEALIESLHREPDEEVRATVAEALGYMGSRQATEPLALALRDRSEKVKVAAARSLGYLGDSSAIRLLVSALGDVDDRVRYAALNALKDPEGTVRDHLVEALRSKDEDLRRGVAETLEAVDWLPANSEEKTLYLVARDRWAEVERIGEHALPILSELLDDRSIEVRANAVKTIARIGGDDAIAPLIRALQDDAVVVRKRAERALVDSGDAALPALTLAITGATPEVQETLQQILNEIRR